MASYRTAAGLLLLRVLHLRALRGLGSPAISPRVLPRAGCVVLSHLIPVSRPHVMLLF